MVIHAPWNVARWIDENSDRKMVKDVCAILMRAFGARAAPRSPDQKDFELLTRDE
ncbi:MAG TPA: hypothetical protein VKA94_15115 [Hyphomicrobiales bacterium]|nr:hypothetical protein [Hyphomicrobiales bacterium]